jgi:hypothetical protein
MRKDMLIQFDDYLTGKLIQSNIVIYSKHDTLIQQEQDSKK